MIRQFLAFVTVAAAASSAWAQCSTAKSASATCTPAEKAACMAGDKSACASAKTAGSGCCMSKATLAAKSAELIPALKYQVGDEVTACSKQAGELAKGDTAKIQYVVGEQHFADLAKAQEAYVQALDTTLADFTTVKYSVGESCVACPMTAKSMAEKEGKPLMYRLAAYNFKSEEAATKAAVAAKEAAAKVKMTMKVDGKDYCCATMAGDAAKACGKPVEYVVGETTSPCKTEAAAGVARAKLDAAIQALDAAYTAGESVASAG